MSDDSDRLGFKAYTRPGQGRGNPKSVSKVHLEERRSRDQVIFADIEDGWPIEFFHIANKRIDGPGYWGLIHVSASETHREAWKIEVSSRSDRLVFLVTAQFQENQQVSVPTKVRVILEDMAKCYLATQNVLHTKDPIWSRDTRASSLGSAVDKARKGQREGVSKNATAHVDASAQSDADFRNWLLQDRKGGF